MVIPMSWPTFSHSLSLRSPLSKPSHPERTAKKRRRKNKKSLPLRRKKKRKVVSPRSLRFSLPSHLSWLVDLSQARAIR